MAKSGFMPAWMKISNSDLTNTKATSPIDLLEQSNSSFEQDFPSLNDHSKSNSSSSNSIWTNAATKFRLNPSEPLKLPYHSRRKQYPSDHHHHSKTLDLSTNFKTRTKNLDKRSDFFNSLKTTLVVSSLPETLEEKDLLIRMGWKDGDEIIYEITDQDREEYEKRLRHFRTHQLVYFQTERTYAGLMSTLHRRALPCLNIQDLLRIERLNSISDDDDDEESSNE